MADIAIFRINYKSDFILTLNSDAGWMTPFCIKFWTGAPSQAYFVGFDGTTYTHCAPVDSEPTKLRVQFDDHHLPIGDLKFQIAYHFTVADFPTSVEDEVLNQASVIIEVDDTPAQVMLDLNGETAPEIEFSLPAYTNEAQRIANEEARITAEQQRIANEEARIAAETVRQQNEEQRINQETARMNEFARLKRESEQATTDANAAATLANEKAQLAADKAALAQAAATLANEKAQLAAGKAALANAAAQLANEKAALAQQKAEYAQQQGGYAKDQGDYAKNQGDYAKEQGDTALADHQRAEADHGIAVDDHTQAGNDHTRAESDHGIAADDHTQAGNDHTRAESDHGIAADDHTQAGNDHTRAESDHGIAADDHTQAGNDHTRAESDHTRAESDHAAVEMYVDSLGVFDLSKHNAVGGVLATYADLSAALNALNALDSQYKYGGMSFKFVQSSDNKYVQYRYTGTATTGSPNPFLDTANWQGVDDEPTAGSDNLVKSGGVKESFDDVYIKLHKRNVDRNEFTEYTTQYNFNASGTALNPIGGLYCTMPIKAGSIIEIVYGENMVNTTCCCLLNLQHPSISYGNNVINKGWIAAGITSDVLQATGPNKTLKLKAIENCWLYIVPGSTYSYWPISLTIKEEGNIYDDLNNKFIECDERITTLEEKEAALPVKTTISSILSPNYFGTKTKTANVNVYNNIQWGGSYIKLSNKKYRVAVKIGVVSERTDVTYKAAFYHNTQMTDGDLVSPTLKYNKVYIIDLGEYLDKGTSQMPFYTTIQNISTTQSHEITATLYGVYVIDADTFDYIEGFENILDYDEQETVVFTNAMKAAHSSTSDFATESTHSAASDLSTETNRVRTAYEGKLVGLYGDSLVTYTSPLYPKYFKPLGMNTSLVGHGGGQVNNRGKNGFCTMERLALLPKNMKVLCFWGGANDGNYYEDRTQPDWIDNAKFGTIDDEPLGVADMFNYHLTVENMDNLNTPGVTQTFFQAYKTMLRNISLLFPHTLLVCVTQYRAYYYDWTQGKDSVIFRKHWPRLIAAEKACCEEYSVPVCDLYTKAGVNDSNCFTMLNDDGGSLIHPYGQLGDRCVNLIAQSVKENIFLVAPNDAWTYNLNNNDKDVRELKEYLVDLRSETQINYMTLEEAIQGFISYTTEKSITLKNNMYLVFYNNQYGNSVGYFLVDYPNPSSVDSWQEWVDATVYDMRHRDATLEIDYGVQTLSEAIASFTHKATVEQWAYSNNMYMYFLTDDNGSWSMYRLSTPSAPSSTSSWTFVKSGQANT